MSPVTICVQTSIERTPRVLQIEGIFDLPTEKVSRVAWQVHLPLDERPWHIGLLVGPSGCGKSTIARHFWTQVLNTLQAQVSWPTDRSILDAFPETLSAKEIVELLSSVGFSSPPAWLRPYHVLSTGQQFRVSMARLLAECPRLAVVDEFTSTVDRTVAQIGSAALAKTVRKRRQQFIAITCHEDVEPWLNPDWVYRPDSNTFTWRLLQRRPAIALDICRVDPPAWQLFKPHHYLSTKLAPGAICFGAFWHERPVAFSAWIHSVSHRHGKREHRTVTLPDFQGAGIGHALSGHIASMWRGLGYRATSTTTHPAFLAARRKDRNWILIRAPSFAPAPHGRLVRLKHATTRLTAGFEYVGPPLPFAQACRLLGK
jgi:ABC-type lipoprotein export system ATPase subunit/GNAT superfamily N-acetyltransferase